MSPQSTKASSPETQPDEHVQLRPGNMEASTQDLSGPDEQSGTAKEAKTQPRNDATESVEQRHSDNASTCDAGYATSKPVENDAEPSQPVTALPTHTPTIDQQQEAKRPWVTNLTVQIKEQSGVTREINVVTVNISTRGFAFVYKGYLYLGTKVVAELDALPRHPVIEGVVRKCVYVKGAHHVSVEFITPT